jgi:hypothetical protein
MNHEIEKKNMDIALLTEKCNKMEALLSDLQVAVFNQEAEKAHKECRFRLYEEELKCAVDLRGQLNTAKQILVFIEKATPFPRAAVHTSETLVNFYETTWNNTPEGCHLHTHHCDNLKY